MARLSRIIFTQFHGFSTPVVATVGSPFSISLSCPDNNEWECSGTMIEYATFYFGGYFEASNRGLDVGILLVWLIVAFFGTWICLKKFNYVNT